MHFPVWSKVFTNLVLKILSSSFGNFGSVKIKKPRNFDQRFSRVKDLKTLLVSNHVFLLLLHYQVSYNRCNRLTANWFSYVSEFFRFFVCLILSVFFLLFWQAKFQSIHINQWKSSGHLLQYLVYFLYVKH